MPRDFLDSILDSVETGSKFGVTALAGLIADKAGEADDPVAAFVLTSCANMLRKHGIEGLGMARAQLDALLDGDNLDPTELRKLPLSERAPLLAAATQREINARKVGDEALAAVGSVLGKLVEGLASGAFSA